MLPVGCCSVTKLCQTLYNPMDCSTPGFPVLHHLLEFCSNSWSIDQWCHPTISFSVVPFSSCLQYFPASGSFPMSWLFTSGWSEDWSFSFSISPFNEYWGLISFRIDWLDLRAVQGILKNLLQHHSSKAPILQHLCESWTIKKADCQRIDAFEM